MKNVLIVLAFCFVSNLAPAQSGPIQDFYQKYKSMDQVENIQMKGWVLKLIAQFTEEKEEKWLRQITRLRLLNIADGQLVPQTDYQDLVRKVHDHRFEDLLDVRDQGEHVRIMVREKEDYISDILLLVRGTDSFTLLSLEGALRLQDLKNLQLDIEGGDHFQRIPASGKATIPRA